MADPCYRLSLAPVSGRLKPSLRIMVVEAGVQKERSPFITA